MRKQIVKKMEARMEIATTEAADLAAKQFMAEPQPWIEREKAEQSTDCGDRKTWLPSNRKTVGPECSS
jgi:hypothetical protein